MPLSAKEPAQGLAVVPRSALHGGDPVLHQQKLQLLSLIPGDVEQQRFGQGTLLLVLNTKMSVTLYQRTPLFATVDLTAHASVSTP